MWIRTSIEAAVIKGMTYEHARGMYATIAEINHDQKAQFDRIMDEVSSIMAMKQNVDENLIRARCMIVDEMERHLHTGLGISDSFYKQLPNEPKIGGEIQGKGDVHQFLFSRLQSK